MAPSAAAIPASHSSALNAPVSRPVALLPWGDFVEDYLEHLDLDFHTFAAEHEGGWMFGYVESLASAGIPTVIVCLSSRFEVPIRLTHRATGAAMIGLPASVPFRRIHARRLEAQSDASGGPNVRRALLTRPLRSTWGALGPYLQVPVFGLARLLREEGCAALICQEYEYARFDLCVAIGRLLRVPVIGCFQGGGVHSSRLERAIRPRTIRRAAALVVASQPEADRVRREYGVAGDRIASIPNSVRVRDWVRVDQASARRDLGVPVESYVIVWHGRIEFERKGLDVVLDAFEDLQRQTFDRPIHLLLVGSGPDAGVVRKHLQRPGLESVTWLDEFVGDRSTLARCLSAGDVYVFPSRREGFAIAPLEAMACGLPVVATDVSGMREMLLHGGPPAGIIVGAPNAAALSSGLAQVLGDGELRHRLGRHARQRADTIFATEVVGRQLAELVHTRAQPLLSTPTVHAIPPVENDADRPYWSVMIPTHNGGDFLAQTLQSVLAQDPGADRMQIEVVDDFSDDDTASRIAWEVGGGRVQVFRQPSHVGYLANFETCLRRARGEVVHVLHDDDYVLDGFYRNLKPAFEDRSCPGAAFCRTIYRYENGATDVVSPLEQAESGVLQGWLERIASGQRIGTPSVVVRRAVYENLGGFDGRFTRNAGEDWEMWVRIAAHYPVWFEPEPLAVYRVKSPGSLTSAAWKSGSLVSDLRRAVDIVAAHLPPHSRVSRRARRRALAHYAYWGVREARESLERGDLPVATRLAMEALKCRVARLTVTCMGQVIMHRIGAGLRWRR